MRGMVLGLMMIDMKCGVAMQRCEKGKNSGRGVNAGCSWMQLDDD